VIVTAVVDRIRIEIGEIVDDEMMREVVRIGDRAVRGFVKTEIDRSICDGCVAAMIRYSLFRQPGSPRQLRLFV
jgi:hypothetical protein